MADKTSVPETSSTTTPASSSSSPSSTSPSASTDDHPLETSWTFYFDKKLNRDQQAAQQQPTQAVAQQTSASQTSSSSSQPSSSNFAHYAQNLQKIGNFNSIEGFWRHYSYLNSPEQIPRDHNLYLFRDSLLPAWETFPQGGCWIIKVRRGNGVIHRLWEELCFACVGEWFHDPDVVGVSLATRVKDDNIAVWNRGPDMNARIGERLKDLLNLDESTQVEYKAFKNAIQDNSSFRNAKAFTYAPTTVATAPAPAAAAAAPDAAAPASQ